MENNNVKKLEMKSSDIINQKIEKISELFPNVVKEGKIDFSALKLELSDELIDENKDRYQLTWPGKKQAIVEINSRINKTLRPIKNKSSNFDKTENLYIEGDNFEVLKILQESYLNKIKCIYIDPPYNTGNDFIYNDNFYNSSKEELINSGRIGEDDCVLINKDINNNSNGRFHSDWIKMMYKRLRLCRNLLSKDGVIFISIDDNELYNLKMICDEIFGEKNFITNLIVTSAPAGTQSSNDFAIQQAYCLVYRKTDAYHTAYIKNTENELEKKYSYGSDDKGRFYIERLWKRGIGGRKEDVPSLHFPVYYNKKTNEIFIDKEFDEKNLSDDIVKIIPYQTEGVLGRWTWSREKMISQRNDLIVTVVANEYKLHKKVYEKDDIGKKPFTIIDSKLGRTELGSLEIKELFNGKVFDYPKYSEFIKYLINLHESKDGIILDFFSGSATTAHAVMKLNAEDGGKRKFIMVQLPEKCFEQSEAFKDGYKTICDIGEERIRRAGEKIKKETKADIDFGFRVYKVADSNMKDVYYEPSRLNQTQLNIFESNIKEDRTSEDLLTQVILDLGLTLDLSIEEKNILGNQVYFVAENSLVACFDSQINIDILNQICEVKPLKVVFRESSFINDSDKINAYERIKKLSPETEISVI